MCVSINVVRVWIAMIAGHAVFGAEAVSAIDKRIEEIVVYGNRTEATVSDTSVSITAFDAEFLQGMGIQNPDELVDFIPATTRQDWDLKIRGVGRNGRALGNDPGVGTYYNGIYSPNFGVAATEAGLYDVERIEVLRGPQGTLYGRNSIGGVLNYVTRAPNREHYEGQARVVFGRHRTREAYGFLSGPLSDQWAFRLTRTTRLSDGQIEGFGPSDDQDDRDDQTLALILDWVPNDRFSARMRFSDRSSRSTGSFGNAGLGVVSEGPCISETVVTDVDDCDPRWRVARDTNHYAAGLRSVAADWPGAFPFRHPVTGERVYGHYNRPGVDVARYPFSPSPNYRDPWVQRYDIDDADDPDRLVLHNDFAASAFERQSTSLTLDWTPSDRIALRYLGNYQWGSGSFDRDNDFSASTLSSLGDTVVATDRSWSHELRVFWSAGDRWTATSGLYYFEENAQQHYSMVNRYAKGYAVNPAIYGPDGDEDWVLRALSLTPFALPECVDWRALPDEGPTQFGVYCGDPGEPHNLDNDVGTLFGTNNRIRNEAVAFYTQGDLRLSDTLSVTLGVRYSEDRRNALENRGGYFEVPLMSPDWDFLPGLLAFTAPAGFDAAQFFAPGVTPLAALNVAMGAATFTGDPDNPIEPVCPLEARTCARPLRLGGIPISWGSLGRGGYSDSNWTFRVNFNWEPVEEVLVYAGVTSGYRAGGFGLGAGDNRVDVGVGSAAQIALLTFDTEHVLAYEVGYKGVHLDGRLQVSASAYYYDFQDYQDFVRHWESQPSRFETPDGVGLPLERGPVDISVNVPEAHNLGFEADVQWLANDRVTVGGNYSYTINEWDTAFTLFNDNDPRYPLEVFGGDLSQDPCTLSPEIAALYCLTVKGQQLTGIPKHKGVIWGSYRQPLPNGELLFRASMSITGEYSYSPFDRPWEQVPSRSATDVRATYESASGRWAASLYVDNLFDQRNVRRADLETFNGAGGINYPHRVVVLPERFVGFEATVNFGGR